MISNFTNDKINELYEYSIEVLFEEYYTMAYKKALFMLSNEEYAKIYNLHVTVYEELESIYVMRKELQR